MRTRTPTLLLATLAVATIVSGCGSAAGPATTTTTTTITTTTTVTATPPTPPPLPSVGPTLAPTIEPSGPAAPPVLTGDATTNAACELASVAEISAQVSAGVREIKGLTSPGSYGKTSLTCAWYLDSTDIGIPSVLAQWEFPVTTHHDGVVDLYRLIVEQDLATKIKDVGDMAILQGRTAEAIDGKRIVRVSVLQHVEPTEKDKQDAIALLKLFLERTAPE